MLGRGGFHSADNTAAHWTVRLVDSSLSGIATVHLYDSDGFEDKFFDTARSEPYEPGLIRSC